MSNKSILSAFDSSGRKASYHYADDSCGEWGLGDRHKRVALALFDANRHLRTQMRELAKGFLWSLSMERPE